MQIGRLGNMRKIRLHVDVLKLTLRGVFFKRFAWCGGRSLSLGLAVIADGAVDEVLDISALRSILKHEVALLHQIFGLLPPPLLVLLSERMIRLLVFFRHFSPGLLQNLIDLDKIHLRVLFFNFCILKLMKPGMVCNDVFRLNLKLLPELILVHSLLAPVPLFLS